MMLMDRLLAQLSVGITVFSPDQSQASIQAAAGIHLAPIHSLAIERIRHIAVVVHRNKPAAHTADLHSHHTQYFATATHAVSIEYTA